MFFKARNVKILRQIGQMPSTVNKMYHRDWLHLESVGTVTLYTCNISRWKHTSAQQNWRKWEGRRGVQEFLLSDRPLKRPNWPLGCRFAWAQPSKARFHPCAWDSIPYIRHAYSAFWQNDFQSRSIGCRGGLRDKRRGNFPTSTLYCLIIKHVTFSILYKL